MRSVDEEVDAESWIAPCGLVVAVQPSNAQATLALANRAFPLPETLRHLKRVFSVARVSGALWADTCSLQVPRRGLAEGP